VVALEELMESAQDIYSRTFETIPLLIVASLWYLALTTLLSVAQHFIEVYYSREHGGRRR
jgi:polar amino acid transport system permease protein